MFLVHEIGSDFVVESGHCYLLRLMFKIRTDSDLIMASDRCCSLCCPPVFSILKTGSGFIVVRDCNIYCGTWWNIRLTSRYIPHSTVLVGSDLKDRVIRKSLPYRTIPLPGWRIHTCSSTLLFHVRLSYFLDIYFLFLGYRGLHAYGHRSTAEERRHGVRF